MIVLKMAGNYTNIIDKLHLIDAEIVKNQEKINDLVIEKEQYIALLRVNQELDDLEKFFEERSIILLSQINDITQNLENYKSTTDQLLRNNENYCQRCEKIIYLNQVEVICSGMCNNHFHVNCVNLREKLNKLCLKIDQIEFVCINCNFNTDTLKINMTNQMKLQSGKTKEESEKKEKSDLIPVNTASSTEYEDLKKNGVLLDKNNKKSNESIVNSSMLIEPGLDQMQEIDKNYNDCNSSKVVDESNKIIELRKVNSKLMESKQLTKGLYVGNVDKNINTDHFTRIVKLIIGSEKNVMIYRLQNKNNYGNAFYIQCNISDQLKLLNSQIGESIIIRPFIGDFNVDLKSDLGMKKSRYFTNSKKKKNDTEKRNINKNGSELNKDKTTDTNNLPGVKSKNDVDNKFEKENSTEKNIHQDDTKINLPIDWVENTSVEVEKEKTKLIKKEKNEKKQMTNENIDFMIKNNENQTLDHDSIIKNQEENERNLSNIYNESLINNEENQITKNILNLSISEISSDVMNKQIINKDKRFNGNDKNNQDNFLGNITCEKNKNSEHKVDEMENETNIKKIELIETNDNFDPREISASSNQVTKKKVTEDEVI